MKCPRCSSTRTRRPGVRDPRWKLGSQICLSCDYQGHWLEFCEAIAPEERQRVLAITESLLDRIRKAAEDPSASGRERLEALHETLDRLGGKQPDDDPSN